MESGYIWKAPLTLLVVVLMIPGLVIEPGPISEIVGLGAILSIWGVDWDDSRNS